jgi:hypothetical protein
VHGDHNGEHFLVSAGCGQGLFVSGLECGHRADTILVQLHQVSSLHPQHIDFLAEFGAARGAAT